jgi:hypothetical protein
MATKLTRLTHNIDTIAPSGRELCHLHFSLQAASPETFVFTLLWGHLNNYLFIFINYDTPLWEINEIIQGRILNNT